MSKIQRFELNKAGVRELLQSEGMKSVVQSYTDTVLANVGGTSAGYKGDVIIGRNRAVGRVAVDSDRAKTDNENSNSLLKGLHR